MHAGQQVADGSDGSRWDVRSTFAANHSSQEVGVLARVMDFQAMRVTPKWFTLCHPTAAGKKRSSNFVASKLIQSVTEGGEPTLALGIG